MKKALLPAAIVAALASAPAFAYQTGDILIRAGITTVTPQDDSKNVTTTFSNIGNTGAEVSVDENSQLGLNFVYMVNQNFGVELLAATPFDHDINLEKTAAGPLPSIGVNDGDLASSKQLPPSLMALYFPLGASSKFQPYLGAGINYTVFFDEDFTPAREAQGFSDLRLENSWGLTAQLGFDLELTSQFFVNASVRYADIDTTARFRVAGNDSQVEVDIDPIVSSIMLGYKF